MTVGRAIICGGRDYCEIEELMHALDALRPTFVIEGGARGADRLARVWAQVRGVPYKTVDADWNRLGKAAGHERNGRMLLEKPDRVIAFRGGKGTQNMVWQAREAHVATIRIAW